jgi:AhpD family alkylhydroperoxidase
MMARDWKAMAHDVVQKGATLYKASPKVLGAFGELATAATADGALTKKTKELMAVAISIVDRCEPCVAYHTQAAIKAGAGREEFVETVNVAIEMGGGPATVYGARALEAFDVLSA